MGRPERERWMKLNKNWMEIEPIKEWIRLCQKERITWLTTTWECDLGGTFTCLGMHWLVICG